MSYFSFVGWPATTWCSNFLFSLWVTALICPRGLLQSNLAFYSLYELQDLARLVPGDYVQLLSILFMSYWWWPAERDPELQCLAFYSLYELPRLSMSAFIRAYSAIFLFSLWVTPPRWARPTTSRLCSFYSLYELHLHPWFHGKLLCSALSILFMSYGTYKSFDYLFVKGISFYSLYELQEYRGYLRLYGYNDLSILFMSYMRVWKAGRTTGVTTFLFSLWVTGAGGDNRARGLGYFLFSLWVTPVCRNYKMMSLDHFLFSLWVTRAECYA